MFVSAHQRGWGGWGRWGGCLSFTSFFVSFTLFTYCYFVLSFAFGDFRRGGTAPWVLAPEVKTDHIALCGLEQAVRLYAASGLELFCFGVGGSLSFPSSLPSDVLFCLSSLLKETGMKKKKRII